jgi:GntR family transcriptional regulator, galactonate operon transcriptional repressor
MLNNFSYPSQSTQLGARRLYQHVVNQIGLRIVRGEYVSSEILPGEEVLVSEFGVSRTVIREAIKVLTEKGLVQPRTKVGTLVHPRYSWNWLDPDVLNWEIQAGQMHSLLRKVTEARRIIEPEVAALAARRGSDEEIAQVTDAYRRMEQNPDNVPEYIAADMVFHAAIMDACHNEMLAQMADTMRRALIASREVTLQLPGNSWKALPLHLAVLQAIQKRDSQAAFDAMRNLIERAAFDIEMALGEIERKQAKE